MIINIFIQARMSSSRYPGKVLAPLSGIPLIKHLIDRTEEINPKHKVVVLTSIEPSDDPLVAYLEKIHCSYFRGDLENVFARFQNCLEQCPCDYFVRLCADSPFLEPNLINALLEYAKESRYDLISNVFNRKFPKGQSVEIAKSEAFLKLSSSILTAYEHEHVMSYYYNHLDNYSTLFFESTEDLSHINMCVDTLEDLKSLEKLGRFYNFDKSKLCIKMH